MDLSYGEEYEKFRTDVRAFLEANWPPSGDEAELPRAEGAARFRDRATEGGFLRRGIPKEFGGSEQPPDEIEANIIREEFSRAHAPMDVRGIGTMMLVPTLLERGNQWQKEKFVEGTVKGEIRWCQGYSEPGAGSDLASLQTRAVRDGDEYVITGQKIWTTGADKADWIFCLVRTDPEAPKHDGISFILFSMHQPGVEVAPLRLIDGSADFSQVFFDGARAKAKNVVGPVNGGWTVAKRLLQHERSTDGGSEGGITGAQKETLVELVKREVGLENGVLADPAIRQRLAAQELEADALRLTMRRAGEEFRANQMGRDIGSLGKYRWANMVKNEQDIAMLALGTQGLGWSGPGFEDTQLERTRAWLSTRADSIWGGTNEVQLNVIAKRVLQIPE